MADFAVLHDAVDFGNDGRFTRLARFEQLDHARQTARDVLGLGGCARDLREHIARMHFFAIAHHQVSVRRHEIAFLCPSGRRLRACTMTVGNRFSSGESVTTSCDIAGDFVDLLLRVMPSTRSLK